MRAQGAARGRPAAAARRGALALPELQQSRPGNNQGSGTPAARRRRESCLSRAATAVVRKMGFPKIPRPLPRCSHAGFHDRRAGCAPSKPQLGRRFMFKLSWTAAALLACTLVTTAHATGQFRDREDAAVIREWNLLAEGVIPASAGPTQPRTYAMMHIAMFDAVNSIEGGYTVVSRRGSPRRVIASSEAAAAQAAHDVLVALWPANTAQFDTALNARLATIHPFRAQLGAQVGREVAKKILEWRTNDGWATPQTLHAAGAAGPVAADAAGLRAGQLRAGGRCPALRAAHSLLLPAAPPAGARQPGVRGCRQRDQGHRRRHQRGAHRRADAAGQALGQRRLQGATGAPSGTR